MKPSTRTVSITKRALSMQRWGLPVGLSANTTTHRQNLLSLAKSPLPHGRCQLPLCALCSHRTQQGFRGIDWQE